MKQVKIKLILLITLTASVITLYSYFFALKLFPFNDEQLYLFRLLLFPSVVFLVIIGIFINLYWLKPALLAQKMIKIDKKYDYEKLLKGWEAVTSIPLKSAFLGSFFTLILIVFLSTFFGIYSNLSFKQIIYGDILGVFDALFILISGYLLIQSVVKPIIADFIPIIKNKEFQIRWSGRKFSMIKKLIILSVALTIMPTMLIGVLSHQQYSKLFENKKEVYLKVSEARNFEIVTEDLTLPILLIASTSSIFAIFVGFIFSRSFTKPIKDVIDGVERISQGDLTRDVIIVSDDELEDLGWSVQKMAERLREIIGGIRGSTENLNSAVRSITHSMDKVINGSELQAEASKEALKSIEEVNNAIKEISNNVDLLSFSAKEIFNSTLKLNKEIAGIDESVSTTNRAIDEAGSSLSEMNATINNVAEYAESLTQAAEETTHETQQMDTSIVKIEEAARQTLELSQQVKRDAQNGWESVSLSIEGMDKINESSKTVEKVIDRLSEKVENIDRLIDVINSVASQTALLSLNSSILASQVGEQGGKIGSLSSEIKTMAEKTVLSTREITDLIRDLKEESKNAKDAVDISTEKVRQGVSLSKKAGEALVKIVESNIKLVSMNNIIAKSTIDQSFMSKRIFGSTENVFIMTKEISRAVDEQRNGILSLLKGVTNIRDASHSIKESTSEESKRCGDLSRNIQTINLMISAISKSVKQQEYESEKVVKAEKDITDIAQLNLVSTGELARVISGLNNQADLFRREISKFSI